MRKRFRLVVPMLATLLALASCGSSTKVGDESQLNFKDQANSRLGERSPSPSLAAKTGAPPDQKQAVGSPTPNAKPSQQATQQAAITVAINSDSAGSAFDPSAVRVSKGSKVTWVNKDSVARSVEADDGHFNSGNLNPGASFTYVAGQLGKFNYHDGSRPYAIGSIEVVA